MESLLDVFGINWKLLLVQGVNFALLLFILWYFLYRPVLRIIDERRERIAEGVCTAAMAGKKLEAAQQESDAIVGKAAREAESLFSASRARASEEGAEIIKQAESRSGAILADAQAQAAEAKRQALLESEKEIARAAVLAAEKIMRNQGAKRL